MVLLHEIDIMWPEWKWVTDKLVHAPLPPTSNTPRNNNAIKHPQWTNSVFDFVQYSIIYVIFVPPASHNFSQNSLVRYSITINGRYSNHLQIRFRLLSKSTMCRFSKLKWVKPKSKLHISLASQHEQTWIRSIHFYTSTTRLAKRFFVTASDVGDCWLLISTQYVYNT